MRDVVLEDRSTWNALTIAKLGLPAMSIRGRFIPYFKYLRQKLQRIGIPPQNAFGQKRERRKGFRLRAGFKGEYRMPYAEHFAGTYSERKGQDAPRKNI